MRSLTQACHACRVAGEHVVALLVALSPGGPQRQPRRVQALLLHPGPGHLPRDPVLVLPRPRHPRLEGLPALPPARGEVYTDCVRLERVLVV